MIVSNFTSHYLRSGNMTFVKSQKSNNTILPPMQPPLSLLVFHFKRIIIMVLINDGKMVDFIALKDTQAVFLTDLVYPVLNVCSFI